ncbi:TonB family protein [Pseudoxanthomonas sp. 10H]|uniref:TonB family protein n=1 Tax=Pseudoxanthomonas sp. 10H TaxID=3242729 RepID=UPI003555F60F
MDADLFAPLVETTLAGSAALLLVLALRRPVRATLGATAAYALWLCVPAALLAVLLPRGVDVPLGLPVAWQVAPAMVVVPASEPRVGMGLRELAVLAWLVGVLGSVALLGLQQRRFHRSLGTLRRRADGLFESTTATAGLPAVAGVLRPRILLPADFERRYSPRQQALVLQHERVHVRRGDLVVNALAASLCCVFWFNPLLPFALRRFRLDQELACDEWVIARNPRARRHYGEAMLKTHFDERPLPLGCHWQARHPIQERIDMLKRPTPTPLHWMAALLFAAGLSASTGYVAWAAQPGDAPAAAGGTGEFVIARQATHGGVTGGLLVQQVAAGEPATSIVGSGEDQWTSTVVATAGKEPGTTYLRFELKQGDPGVRVAQPSVLVRDGEAGAIERRDDAGTIVYRVVFRVLPVNGAGAETQERMRQLLAEGEAGPAGEAAADGVQPARADEHPVVASATVNQRMPPPHYPVEAARQYIGGKVMLLATVAADGTLRDVQIESAEPQGVFDEVSLAAARKWVYQPAMQDGRPVEGRVRIPITFSAAPANDKPSPVTGTDFVDYQWMRVPKDSVAAAACDIVRASSAGDEAGDVYCGIRKSTAAR